MKKLSLIAILSLSFLIGCSTNPDTINNQNDLHIYTSIYPIAFATEQIVGELATVTSIYPPGVDSHNFEPTSREITAIAQGDAFIYLGSMMESFATSVKGALKQQPLLFIELGLEDELFHNEHESEEDENDHGHDHDPHIWLDPLRMLEIGAIIQRELSTAYPTHRATFAENFKTFEKSMLDLDDAFYTHFNESETNYIIVTHGAYEYWEKRYHIKQIPIRGRSTSDEPSQKDLVAVAKIAAEKNIHHVLFEQNNEDYVSKIILEHINGEQLYIHNLEVLSEADIANGEDYISLMEQNLQTLKIATHKGGN